MFYEALKEMTEYGKQMWVSESNLHLSSSVEGFILGGLAGGMSMIMHYCVLLDFYYYCDLCAS